MTLRTRRALAAGGLYVALYLALTGMVPAPSSSEARMLMGHLYLLLPTLAAIFATAQAARRSLGAERAFWSLLSAAAAAQLVAEAAFLLHAMAFPQRASLLGLGHAGHYTFTVFVALSVLVSPHRPLSAGRLRAATVEWAMAAMAAYFLIFYFVAVPLSEASYPWFWIFTLQQVVLAAGFVALAVAVKAAPFSAVYRILAVGLGAAAIAGVLPNWRDAAGGYDSYSPAHVDWILTLVAIAAAACVDRGPAWVPGREDAEPTVRRGWVMAATVVLPLAVDFVTRLLGAHPALAAQRTLVALAATGVLLVLTALRVRRPPPGVAEAAEAAAPPSAEGSSHYVHFATGVAHEMNNPLMAVGGWAELALRKTQPRESLESLLAATRRATQAVQRLQQLGRAAEPAPPGSPVPGGLDSGGIIAPVSLTSSRTRRLILAGLAFAVLYFALRHVEPAPWMGDALLLLPPAAAAVILWRRGEGTRSRRRAAFWRLLAAGAAMWATAEGVWTAFELLGVPPKLGAGRLLDVLFLGFLVPMVAALGLRAHPRVVRKDPAVVPDAALIVVAAGYAFVRLVVLSALTIDEPLSTKKILLGALWAVVAVWSAVLWRAVDHPSWRRAYGALALFALGYGTLSAVANGLRGQALPPGSWADVGWFLPFGILISAAWGGRPTRTDAFPALLAAGAGPVVLDLLLTDAVPIPVSAAGMVAAACPALLAIAGAVRLRWQVEVDRRARHEARLHVEETQRAGRLTTLASLVAASVSDLEDQLEEVCRRARAASVVMPEKGEQMLQQARRARDIVRELSSAFRLVPPGPRRDLEVAALLEEVVEGALDEGLPLHVSLEGLGGLPPVHGDPRALSAAISHLLRNAAQASPGGVLRIRGALREGEVELRFADDGPGVPAALRDQIFDPFFTTRRVGEGVGLGLTLVHFVARGHGGSIVLEESSAGACFALRLPARPAVAETAVRTTWPFVAAAGLSGVAAILMAVEPTPSARETFSVVFQIASAVAAAAAMGWAAFKHQGSRRVFWAWMAAGPTIWAVTRLVRVSEGGMAGRPSAGIWPLVAYAAADLSWAAALLLRPDQRHERPSSRLGFSAGAALCLFAYAHAHLVVLPDPFAISDAGLRHQLVLLRALQKIALPVWAGVLAWRALTPYWRGFYFRIATGLAAWAIGQSLAFAQRSQPGYAAGGAGDLGWIIPFFCVAALAVYETGRANGEEETPTLGERLRPGGSAGWLLAVAAIVAADALFGISSGYPALDSARATLTRAMVVVMALILAGREVLAARESQRAWQGRFPRDAGPSRWARLVSSAVHELGSHLSGIIALARLLLSQSEASPRLRADALRLHDRAESATRVVRNLLAALPSSVGTRERISANRVVEDAVETRREALAADGIVVGSALARDLPEMPLDAPALRHVILALLDRAAVAIRGGGAEGHIEVATAVRGDAVVITVGDSGTAAGGAVLARLMDTLLDSPEPRVDSDLQRSLVRESVERQGGSLAVGNRPGGGTEFVVRLPIPAADFPRPAAQPVTPAARSGTHGGE
jgi:signal transduction histidine kinase